MLFRASHAIPPVSEPSPTKATTVPGFRCSRMAFASPSAYESAVDACEFATQSCPDSVESGYPDNPWRWRNVGN